MDVGEICIVAMLVSALVATGISRGRTITRRPPNTLASHVLWALAIALPALALARVDEWATPDLMTLAALDLAVVALAVWEWRHETRRRRSPRHRGSD